MQRILGVLAFLICCLHYSHTVKSSCVVQPVKLGDEATLSCRFDVDISKLQRDVLVYLYKDNTEHPVVIYAWHDGKAKIYTMEGYRCAGNISDYLVIKIANVNENNTGRYSCLRALSTGESTTCALRITEHHASDWNNVRIAVIVSGVLLGALVVILLTIMIIVIWNGWIPACCSKQKNHDSLISNCITNCNVINIYKSTLTYKGNNKMEDHLKQTLIEPVELRDGDCLMSTKTCEGNDNKLSTLYITDRV